jgi:Ras-related protein Rab-35
MGIQLFEASAKENINVEEMFKAITNLVLSSKKAQRESLDRPHGQNLRLDNRGRPNGGTKQKKNNCCK